MRRESIRRILIITGLLCFLTATAHAATITVINTNDAGAGSLRQAIISATAGDTIDFGVTGTITLTTGELGISKNLTITGPGASSLTIDGNNSSRIFMVNSGFTLTLSGVTINNGNSATWGGGIANEGTLHISDSVITNCDANGGGNGYGGAIDSYNGTLTVTNCTLTGNTAVNRGGGIHIENGSCTVTESTISLNTTDNGGGIYSLNAATDVIRSTIYDNNANAGGSNHGGGIFGHGGTLNVTNSTISGNNAVGGGGGIIDGAATTITINSCTIAYNVSTNGGGGIEMDFTAANIKNTILAHNTGGGANNFFSGGGSLNSQGYNLENGTECGFAGAGDQQSVSAGLDPIADNGGPTQTHALQAGSNALDTIPGPGFNGAPGTDQRGVARPQNTNADCGAFELQQAPAVTTQAVSAIATTTATGNGAITSLGSPDPTAHGMVWNTTGSPTLADNSSDEGATSTTGAFTSNMTGLSPYTTYYVKAYATNANGTAYGNEVSFTTQGIAPAVTTQAVSVIGTTTATGNGTITTLGVPNPTAHGMVWNTTGNPTLADNSSNEGPAVGTGPFTSNMIGLSPGVTYYVKAYATNAVGTVYGNEVSFTTTTQAAAVTTQAVSGIGTTTATGNGTITGLGAPNPTAHGMVWNTTGNPTLADNSSNEGPAGSTGPFTSNMTGLSPGVTYYVKAYATNLAGTVYGNEVSFTTATQPAAVTTQAVSGIGTTTATGNGTITGLGAPNPTAHGMVWNSTGNPTLADNSSNEGAAAGTGPFTSNMTGLTAGVTYYVKAYATNLAGTVYGNEVSFTTATQPAAVTTQPVSAIGTTTATGNGTITSLGAPNPTAHGMVWNITGNPTLADNSSNEGPAAGTGPFTSNMTGLTAGVTYYVKAYATNPAGTVYGNEVSFTAATQPAAVTTQAVSGIGTTTATGNGTITSLGAPNPTAHGMVWNTTGNPTLADNSSDEGPAAGTGAFTSNMTGLTAGVTYYVKAYATNPAGTVYGNEVSFTAATQPPTVTTQAVSAIGTTTATGNGTITGLGAPNPTAHGMVWNTTGNPTLADNSSDEGAASATGAFTSNMTGLTAGVTYYVKTYATNQAGTVYGNQVSFTTATQLPTVTTQAVSGIGTTTATGNGNITDLGAPNPSAHGMVWNTTGNPTLADNSSNEGVAAFTGAFTSDMTGLSPNTTYYVKAYATNAAGTVYGNEVSFTTKPQLPTVTTQAVSDIDTPTAMGNGTITDPGAPNPTAHGMVWNDTGALPTLADNFTDEGPVSATGAFTSVLTGLAPNTTYYVRAYATNAAGTTYGNKVIFNTGGGLPSVSTTMVSDITDTSATGGGKVTDEGGDTVTARGVCWGISSRPTTADDHTNDGTGGGWFTSYLTGLTPNTTYYYRAYATNSLGTAYGREKTFTTKGQPEPPTVEIIDPEDGANVSGVVTIKAKAESKQGIENVEFFVDGDKIGDGTITQASRGNLDFNLSGAHTLFIDDNNRLQKTGKRGNPAAVMNIDIETVYIQAGPDGSIYVNFKSPRRLADGNTYLLVRVNPADGSYRGIDSSMSKLFTGFKTTPAMQFDGAGHLYYLAARNDGKLCLKQCMHETKTLLLFDEDTEIDEWFTGKDGTVILAGKTLSTGAGWLKSKAPGAALNHLTGLYSHIRKIAASADGCIYAVTEEGAYRVSGNRAVEIAPNRLPTDVKNHNTLTKAAVPGKKIDLEFIHIRSMGKTYSIDWDTTLYDFGNHTITAAVHDTAGQRAEDSISVNIPEILLTLVASRETERAWIVSKLYGKLEIMAVNLSDVPVSKYVIYRKVVDEGVNTLNTNTEGEFTAIASFTDADLEDWLYTYDDKYLEQDKIYIYKVEAKDENDAVIAVSEEITI